ncbi:hypothetical protein CGRA01v4_08347 [Colletotrichum graminicola]|nr:hypothetical protein CGRA01v4_08347 [Colletotrichum graminicola]
MGPDRSIWRVGVHGEVLDVGIVCRMSAVRRHPERSTRHGPGESPGDIAKRKYPIRPRRPRKRGNATQRHGTGCRDAPVQPTILVQVLNTAKSRRNVCSNGYGPPQQARMTLPAESLVVTVRSVFPERRRPRPDRGRLSCHGGGLMHYPTVLKASICRVVQIKENAIYVPRPYPGQT